MFRKLMITACIGMATWLGTADTSDAQVRVWRGPNRAGVSIGGGYRGWGYRNYYGGNYGYYGGNYGYYGPSYGYYAPTYSYGYRYAAPAYGYGYPGGWGRSVVVTPNRVRIAGPRGVVRFRR